MKSFAIAALLVLSACSSSSDPAKSNPTPEDGGTTPLPAGKPVSAADFCDRVADVVCSSESECCSAGSAGWPGADDCVTKQVAACRGTIGDLVEDPRISLLFVIPAVGETLRVVGRAKITADEEMLARFTVGGKLPRTVIVIEIDSVYFHCSKALIRSKLWDTATWPERSDLPTGGAILAEIANGDFDGEAYDCELPARIAKTLY